MSSDHPQRRIRLSTGIHIDAHRLLFAFGMAMIGFILFAIWQAHLADMREQSRQQRVTTVEVLPSNLGEGKSHLVKARLTLSDGTSAICDFSVTADGGLTKESIVLSLRSKTCSGR